MIENNGMFKVERKPRNKKEAIQWILEEYPEMRTKDVVKEGMKRWGIKIHPSHVSAVRNKTKYKQNKVDFVPEREVVFKDDDEFGSLLEIVKQVDAVVIKTGEKEVILDTLMLVDNIGNTNTIRKVLKFLEAIKR